jgi:aspartate aminotransferase
MDFTPHAEVLARSGILTSEQLCDRLLDDKGVALLPGVDFGRPPYELTCRLAYVDFRGSECLAAAAAVPDSQELSESFLQSYCSNVLDGVDSIASWLRHFNAV